MRSPTCAPLVAACALCAFAQQPCPDNRGLAVIERAMPDLAPAMAPAPQPFSTNLATKAAPDQAGTNHNAVERAIRSLVARIFPGKGSMYSSSRYHSGRVLASGSLGGSDFRLVLGKELGAANCPGSAAPRAH